MPETPERIRSLPDYVQVKSAVQSEETHFLLRQPHGDKLHQIGNLTLLAPWNPDLPLESGKQIQVVNEKIKNSDLGESPLLSEFVNPFEILNVTGAGIATAEWLLRSKRLAQTWVNVNLHSRPPMNPAAPVDAQYDPLVLDIHGRDITDPRNWTRPPATHGAWGLDAEVLYDDLLRRELVTETNHHMDREEIEKYLKDPEHKWDESPPNPANPTDFLNWQSHPSGFYYEGGRRHYLYGEMMELKRVYATKKFENRVNQIQSLRLFQEEPVVNTDLEHSETFKPNDTDMVLFECKFGDRAYQVVTQKNPLVDRENGIHMVVKLRPEPHTPWQNPQQAQEAFAIGVALTRLFQKHRLLKDQDSLGEIGDAYLDMNANWSMTAKRSAIEGMTPQEIRRNLPKIKEEVQERTRAHLHVQLVKIEKTWEVPPAPGTFTENQPQTEKTVEEIRRVLGDEKTGLLSWINQEFKAAA